MLFILCVITVDSFSLSMLFYVMLHVDEGDEIVDIANLKLSSFVTPPTTRQPPHSSLPLVRPAYHKELVLTAKSDHHTEEGGGGGEGLDCFMMLRSCSVVQDKVRTVQGN